MELYYSVDNYGVFRKHENGNEYIILNDQNSIDYIEMREWWVNNGYLISIDRPYVPDLSSMKKQAILDVVDVANQFVKSFTYNTLDCELQSFDTLVADALTVSQQGVLYASKQIIVQSQLTGKTPQQVVDRVIELKNASDMVVPVMSSFRQNSTTMINACTTHEQLDIIKQQILTIGLDSIKELFGNVEVH